LRARGNPVRWPICACARRTFDDHASRRAFSGLNLTISHAFLCAHAAHKKHAHISRARNSHGGRSITGMSLL